MTPKPLPQKKRRGLKPAELKKLEEMQAKSMSYVTADKIIAQAIRKKNLKLLEAVTKHPNWGIRFQAILALERLGATQAIPTIEKIAKTDESFDVRDQAGMTLRKLLAAKAKTI